MTPGAPLASSSHPSSAVTARRDRGNVRRTLTLALVSLGLAACGPTPAMPDGGSAGDGSGPGVPGTVAILPGATEGPPTPVERLDLRIAAVRMVGDRGPELDPRAEGIGLVSVGTVPFEIAIGEVPPALYSAVVLELAPDASGPALELVTTLEHGPTLDIATNEPLVLSARCEHGAAVSTTGMVRMNVDLALGDPVQAVTVMALPAPDGAGVVHVNESTAPEATAAFRAMLQAVVHAECGPDAT